MSYFSNFPLTKYKFGTDLDEDVMQNISVYSDTFDQIRNSVGVYEDYTIIGDTRPDQASMELYGTPDYHWTFFLMNPELRERGWPLSENKVNDKAVADYNLRILTTRTALHNIFKVGQSITGLTSGATATIVSRNLDLGQVAVNNVVGTFTQTETVTSKSATESIVLTASELQYNAAHHYEDASGNWVDIDPSVGPGALVTEKTWLDRLSTQNNELRSIVVVKPQAIQSMVESFREAVRL